MNASWIIMSPCVSPPGPTVASTTVPKGVDRSSCDNTEFGCCPDGKTPSSTPEGANCPCKSKYPFKKHFLYPVITWILPCSSSSVFCLLTVGTIWWDLIKELKSRHHFWASCCSTSFCDSMQSLSVSHISSLFSKGRHRMLIITIFTYTSLSWMQSGTAQNAWHFLI